MSCKKFKYLFKYLLAISMEFEIAGNFAKLSKFRAN